MVYITGMLIVHFSIQVALIIDIFLDGSSKERADDWFEADGADVVVGIFVGFGIFDAIALSLILQLLHFHMQLRKEGLTTYKYIVRESQRKREKANKDQTRKNQRIVAMGKANDEGNYMLAMKLRYGEMCPCCDPLPPTEEEKKEEDHQYQQPMGTRQQPGWNTNGTALPPSPRPPQVEPEEENDDEELLENGAALLIGKSSALNHGTNGNGSEIQFVQVTAA